MVRLTTWAALVAAAGAVVGCGPAKEVPNELPANTAPSDTPTGVPTVSDPAAREFLEKAVKAYTGGKPELVAKGKASRLTLTGVRIHPVENDRVKVETTRTIAAVWPDRFYGKDELKLQGAKSTFAIWLHRPRLTVMEDNQERPTPAGAEEILATDVTGQHWMALLLPLSDPKAVVFDLRKPASEHAYQTMKLSLGALPVYELHFDPKTAVLRAVECTMKEEGARRKKRWSMTDHQTGPEGLLLPMKMECRYDNNMVEEWATAKWEFPATINDSEFTPSKK